MKNTRTASLEDIRDMQDRGEIGAPAPGGRGEGLPEDFWDTAKPRLPRKKQPVSLRVDPDILEYFKETGDGHLTRMHAVLRTYVDAQRKRRSRT